MAGRATSPSAEELLRRLGFGDYESRAYLALVTQGPLNGYGVAKASGIPRPNVYAVLARLEERGAAVHVEGGVASATLYAPVPPAELLARMTYQLNETIQEVGEALSALAKPPEERYIWRIEGREVLLEHARSLIESAQRSLLLAVWPTDARALGRAADQASTAGIQLSTLCLAACEANCGGCHGDVYQYGLAFQSRQGWFAVVADEAEALLGEANGAVTAVRTKDPLVVDLVSQHVHQAIEFGSFVQSLPPAASELAKTQQQGGFGDWLGRLLRRKR